MRIAQIATLGYPVAPDQTGSIELVVWNLTDSGGVRVPAGVYLARLRSGVQSRVRKFVILPGVGGGP